MTLNELWRLDCLHRVVNTMFTISMQTYLMNRVHSKNRRVCCTAPQTKTENGKIVIHRIIVVNKFEVQLLLLEEYFTGWSKKTKSTRSFGRMQQQLSKRE